MTDQSVLARAKCDTMSWSEDLRKLVIKYHSEGKSLREIGRIVDKSFSTVRNIINKYKLSKRIADLPRSGRPKKLSYRDVSKIARQVKKNPGASAVKIAEDISNEGGMKVSASTIRRALHSEGLHSRVPRKKPLIFARNKSRRLKFATENVSRSQNDWNDVMFSDESKFEIFASRRKTKIWRKSNESLNPINLVPTVKHGGGNVMVWGCMAASGVGNLVFIESTMRKEDYLKILQQNLKSSVQKLGLSPNWTFQQDNDPKHTAHVVKNWLSKNVPNELNSPPQSPDLNPIEHLWEHLDRKIRQHDITNANQLKTALQREWDAIPREVTSNLVDSMRRRLEAVLKAKGGPTKY